MRANAKTVLMFLPKWNKDSQDAFSGARAAASALDWNFLSAECYRSGDGRALIERSSPAAGSVADLIGILKPDGVIVWDDALSLREVASAAGPDIPVVFIQQTPPPRAKAAGGGRRTGYVFADPESIASLAARVLFVSGYDDFAYVPYTAGLLWCRERGEAFSRIVRLAGKRFHQFDWPADAKEPPARGDALDRWLETLEKPCGILAANDGTGEMVLASCARLGLRVPDDIAVVGVENLLYLCETVTPTLSSVVTDLAGECREALSLLAALMRRKGGATMARAVPARHVELRASARFARDRRVTAALEFIRLHACAKGFSPRDVVREMGVGRTLADKLFRSSAGRTILDEIHAVRLARARELLRVGRRPDIVSVECGYASYDDFRRVFRRRVGITVRKWTLAHRV